MLLLGTVNPIRQTDWRVSWGVVLTAFRLTVGDSNCRLEIGIAFEVKSNTMAEPHGMIRLLFDEYRQAAGGEGDGSCA